MTERPERRRALVVDPPMQRRMIVALLWPTTVSFVVTALVLVVLGTRMHSSAAAAGVMLENVGAGIAAVIVFLMMAAALGLLHALQVSHRVAGPAHRLRETLRAVRNGDATARARLRSGDYLAETATELNDFLDWVQDQQPAQAEITPQSAVPEPADAAAVVGNRSAHG